MFSEPTIIFMDEDADRMDGTKNGYYIDFCSSSRNATKSRRYNTTPASAKRWNCGTNKSPTFLGGNPFACVSMMSNARLS